MTTLAVERPMRWRWGVGLVLVLAAHGAAYWALRGVHPTHADPTVPQEAVLLDLAPAAEPAPPAPVPSPTPTPTPPQPAPPPPPAAPPPPPPEPPPPVTPPPPEPPPPVVPDLPTPPPVAAPPSEVAMPPPPPPRPRPQRRPPPPRHRPPPPIEHPAPPMETPQPTAAPPVAAPAAPRPAAPPAPAAASAPPGQAAATWQSKLIAHLLQYRRYPPEAERRGIQGTPVLRFSVNSAGHVVSVAVARSSGHDMLDQGALDWLRSAEPLPPPPPERTAPFELVVPFAFTQRD